MDFGESMKNRCPRLATTTQPIREWHSTGNGPRMPQHLTRYGKVLISIDSSPIRMGPRLRLWTIGIALPRLPVGGGLIPAMGLKMVLLEGGNDESASKGQFGFSNFSDGRRYAEFLTFFEEG